MPRLHFATAVKLAILSLGAVAAPRAAFAQFAWDGDCSILWTDCCNYGTPENPEWHNNWTIAPNFTTCPALPGVNDDVFAGGTIMLNTSQHVKGLSVAGTFLFGGSFRSLLMDHDLTITGSPFEPTTFIIQGGPYNIVQLFGTGGTATISSFATLEYQSSGALYGPPTGMLYNDGLIWKTGESVYTPGFPAFPPSLNIPVENNGTIRSQAGTLTLAQGGTNNGIIEALGEGIVAFKGPATYVLDGEVRGDGLIRFFSTFSGGGVSIIGDYHPTNTLIAGGYLPVNFDVNTHIENLTLDNPGVLGGAANLTVDNLTWYGTTSMTAGGMTIVEETALFKKDAPNNGSLALNREMELHGDSIIDTDTLLGMTDTQLRNYGDLEMRGNSTISQGSPSGPSSLVQNFGTVRKASGAPSIINTIFLNIGEVIVENGTLDFDGEMTNDAAITINTGASLRMGHKQQTNFFSGSITGPGGVWFYNDFHSADFTVDSILGTYDVGATTIEAGSVDFQTDGVIAPQKTTATLNIIPGLGTGKLLGDADVIVTDHFNWSAGEMAGTGSTLVYGPMILTGTTYLDRLLELNADATPGKQPPNWTLNIKPLGTLHCKDVTIDGSVNNDGIISPGTPIAPVGHLHLTGGFTQTPGGQLFINKLGPGHDQLIVDGIATLGGTLNASGFPASGGQSFTILTAADVDGTFAQINIPAGMQVVYTDTSVIFQSAPGTPCPADIAPQPNRDGTVNAADLLMVINNWGPCPRCPADINGDGMTNVADLLAVINGWGSCP